MVDRGGLGEDEFGGDEERVGFGFDRGAVLGGEQARVFRFDKSPGGVVAGRRREGETARSAARIM